MRAKTSHYGAPRSSAKQVLLRQPAEFQWHNFVSP